jgi:hypothetical protein
VKGAYFAFFNHIFKAGISRGDGTSGLKLSSFFADIYDIFGDSMFTFRRSRRGRSLNIKLTVGQFELKDQSLKCKIAESRLRRDGCY